MFLERGVEVKKLGVHVAFGCGILIVYRLSYIGEAFASGSVVASVILTQRPVGSRLGLLAHVKKLENCVVELLCCQRRGIAPDHNPLLILGIPTDEDFGPRGWCRRDANDTVGDQREGSAYPIDGD